jgi:hypothetical protein
MIKLYLLYNKSIIKTNILFSFVFALLCLMVVNVDNSLNAMIHKLISCFILAMVTGGFLLSVLYFNLTRKNEYYFYYNTGLTRTRLLLGAWFLHILFIIPFLLIMFYVKPS